MPGKPLLIRFVESDDPSVVVSQGHVKMWSTHDIKDSMFTLEAQVSLLTKIERTLSTLLLLTESMVVLGLLGGAGIIVVTAAM